MTNDTSLGIVGKPKATGGVYRAPLGTTLPTDATTALDAAFKGLGFISDEGVTQAIERSVETIKAWGGLDFRDVQSEYGATYSWSMLQAGDEEVLKTYFGNANVVVTPANSTDPKKVVVDLNASELDHAVYVLEMADGDNKIRVVIKDGKPSEVEDVTFASTDVVRYGVSVKAYPDSVGSVAKLYQSIGLPTA